MNFVAMPRRLFKAASVFKHRRALGWLIVLLCVMSWMVLLCSPLQAQSIPVPKMPFVQPAEGPEDVVLALEIVFLIAILSLAPAILVMMTAFTRVVIVLSFLRRALATQELPPNQIVIGLSLILTYFIMQPTLLAIKNDALIPYIDMDISQKTAFNRTLTHMREFMFGQTLRKDLEFFLTLSKTPPAPEGQVMKRKDVPTAVLVPAFVTSELKRAFQMGFLLYLPFVVIDLVVSSVLISMGMLVLPPILISLPFKILLFVLVDGWTLVLGSIVASFGAG